MTQHRINALISKCPDHLLRSHSTYTCLIGGSTFDVRFMSVFRYNKCAFEHKIEEKGIAHAIPTAAKSGSTPARSTKLFTMATPAATAALLSTAATVLPKSAAAMATTTNAATEA